MTDSHSFRILYAGPDPGNSNGMMVRKVIRVNEDKYFYEVSKINPRDNSVHSQLSYLGNYKLPERVDRKEWNIRQFFRPTPSLIGFSTYWKKLSNGSNHYSVVEGTPCLLYTSPSPRDQRGSRMPSSA